MIFSARSANLREYTLIGISQKVYEDENRKDA